jgi:predicted ATP-grasp superfamily ATP-dependent carboligase
LTIARSLTRKGITVTVGGERYGRNVAFYWRHPKKHNIIYAPPENEELFIETLIKAAKGHDVLIPSHERTILPISRHLCELTKTLRVPVPNYQILEVALDKGKTLKVAQRLGIPTPRTYFISSHRELEQVSERLTYPVVIKLREEVLNPPPRHVYAYSPGDLAVKYVKMSEKGKYPLIQELIKGTGFGFFTLFDEDSEPLAIFCHRRIREYPITGGESTYCESVYEPRLIEYGIKLLKEIKWYGIAMVEFKKDWQDGEYKLMEINPRFWGSLPLASVSGVDFPYLLYQMATGTNIKPCSTYKIGIRYRFLYSDSLALRQALRRSNNRLNYLWSFTKSFFDKDVHYDFSTPILRLIAKLSENVNS